MLSKFYESLYLKVLVNIVVGSSKTTVFIETINNKKEVVSSDEETFDVVYLDSDMREYISSATKETPYYYISVLDNSSSQGAIPTCDKNKFRDYYDISTSDYKCYNEKWAYYTEKSEINEIEKTFAKVGVDFIFSPFVVLSRFFKDKINTHLAAFVLVEEGAVSFSVFNNSYLLYAERLDMDNAMETEDLMIDEHGMDEVVLDIDEESIDLDDIDALDDMDELDDFGNIADLDNIEDIDEFSEAKDIEEELFEEDDDDHGISGPANFNKDYKIFSLIQNAINNFYKDDKYDSEFIENIYIADYAGVSTELKRYFEEEMFLNVYIRRIDLCVEVCEIAKMELS